MNAFPTRMPNECANLTAADSLANPSKHGGLFVKVFRRAIGWFEVRPAALNPSLVRSLAYARINRDYDALGRS
jgi:hypothetical protein